MNRKLILNTLFVVSAIGIGIGLSIKPWKVYGEQRRAANAALADMRDAERNRTDLTRKTARYESAMGREELARQQGYRQANETPVDLEDHSKPVTPD